MRISSLWLRLLLNTHECLYPSSTLHKCSASLLSIPALLETSITSLHTFNTVDLIAMSDIIKTLQKKEEDKAVASVQYYIKYVKNFVNDNKIVKDPAQDNFIKGKEMGVGMIITFILSQGSLALIFLCFLFGYGGHLLRTIIACAYPGYRSLKAILTDDKDDDMAWLRYWVVLASFSLVELVLDLILSWLPGYLIAKCSFLVWCMAPIENNGSNIIFNTVCSTFSTLCQNV